jgi:hypothetical protein
MKKSSMYKDEMRMLSQKHFAEPNKFFVCCLLMSLMLSWVVAAQIKVRLRRMACQLPTTEG